jgi:outer membrane protein assembly factor BamD (BamD/ComL family)
MKYLTMCAVLFLVLLLAAGCGEKLTEEQLRAKAVDLEAQAQWEDAAKAYEGLVKNHSNSTLVDKDLYKLAVIYANNLQLFEKSIATYKRIVDEYPQSQYVIQSNFMIGYRYANDLKDVEKAKVAYQNFMDQYPDHELASSVKWELEHLGQDISEIDLNINENDSATTSQ